MLYFAYKSLKVKFKLILLFICCVSIYPACDRVDSIASSLKNKVKLNLIVEPYSVTTYANPTIDETKINSLLVLFFEKNKGYIGYATKSSLNITMDNIGTVDLDLPTGVTANSSYDVLAIANYQTSYKFSIGEVGVPLEEYIATVAEGKTASEVEESFLVSLETTGDINANNLLMSGYVSGALFGSRVVDITLKRSVVRIDVANSATNFAIESVMIYNGVTKVAPFSTVNAGNRTNYTTEYPFSESSTRTIYILPSSVTECKQNDKKTTCLIVKGKYSEGASTYYRANLVFKGTNQNLEKNKLYTLTISSVSGHGFANASDAYTSSTSKVAYSLTNDWDNTNDNNFPATVTDGIRSLWVSNRKASLSFAKDVSEDISIVATGGAVAVTENLDWLDVASNNNDYTLKTNSANTATDRTGTVTFTVGGQLSLAVNVTQRAILPSEKNLTVNDGAANIEGGTVTIPVTTSGNGIDFNLSDFTGPTGWSIAKNGSSIEVTTTAQPTNTATTAREASFIVTSDDGSTKTVKVYQPARPATIALSSGSLTSFSNEGESRSYTFTCSYGNLSSVSINPASNSGFTAALNGNDVNITAAKQEIFGAPKRSALITVTAVNGATYSFMVEQEEVAIASNSEVVQVGGSGIYWDNRNFGATSSLFFTNENPTAIGTNADAKGLYYTISDNPCTNLKRLPTQAELQALLATLRYDNSKGYGIYYVDGVSKSGAKRRMFFPLAGYGGYDEHKDINSGNKISPASNYTMTNGTIKGLYWSSLESKTNSYGTTFFLMMLTPNNSSCVTEEKAKEYMLSVRCVE